MNQKYQALQAALMYAKGNSIIDKNSMEHWLGKAEKHSSIPLSEKVKDKIWQTYEEYNSARFFECLNTAERNARSIYNYNEDCVGTWLNYAEGFASTKDHRDLLEKRREELHEAYLSIEPRRKYRKLRTALNFARGDSITDHYCVESFKESAQKHSSMPLSQRVKDRIDQVYQASEGRRMRKALSTAWRAAKSHARIDESFCVDWLKYAEGHSKTSLKDRAHFYFTFKFIRFVNNHTEKNLSLAEDMWRRKYSSA